MQQMSEEESQRINDDLDHLLRELLTERFTKEASEFLGYEVRVWLLNDGEEALAEFEKADTEPAPVDVESLEPTTLFEPKIEDNDKFFKAHSDWSVRIENEHSERGGCFRPTDGFMKYMITNEDPARAVPGLPQDALLPDGYGCK